MILNIADRKLTGNLETSARTKHDAITAAGYAELSVNLKYVVIAIGYFTQRRTPMKAHVKTWVEKQKELDRQEVSRVFKLCLMALYRDFGFGQKRLDRALKAISKVAVEAYETPEQWFYIDELLVDRYNLPFDKEDISEREKTAAIIHKEHGKKWRKY